MNLKSHRERDVRLLLVGIGQLEGIVGGEGRHDGLVVRVDDGFGKERRIGSVGADVVVAPFLCCLVEVF